MLYPLSLLSLLLLVLIHLTSGHSSTTNIHTDTTSSPEPSPISIPLSTREYWIRRANRALSELSSPCPFAAFGTVIVNHSDISQSPLGREVCIGVNRNGETGNPTLHGEIAAINNCTNILTDPKGGYKLSPAEAAAAFSELSLYTNAESCPMCASAQAWANFAENVYGTSIATLIKKGWSQITISSEYVFEHSAALGRKTMVLGEVLTNETDPFFFWQYDRSYPCPKGCERSVDGTSCLAV